MATSDKDDNNEADAPKKPDTQDTTETQDTEPPARGDEGAETRPEDSTDDRAGTDAAQDDDPAPEDVPETSGPADEAEQTDARDTDPPKTDPVEEAADHPALEEPDRDGVPEPHTQDSTPPHESEPSPQLAATPAQEKVVVERRGGIAPLLFGGAVAAGLGFAAAQYGGFGAGADDTFETETTQAIQSQAAEIGTLRQDLEAALAANNDALSAATESSNATIGDLASRLDGIETALTDLDSTIGGVDDRLTSLEKRPVEDNISREAIAAYEREIEALRSSVAAQREDFERLLDEARATEAQARQTAQQAAIKTALGRVQAAIDGGTPFASALDELESTAQTPIPDPLRAVADDGAPTVAALQDSFPEAARAALAAARQAQTDEGGGLKAFFESQLGARSVAPRDGDDPDAILSRAEAALRDNQLADALAEIETLPDVAKARMSDWLDQARARMAAIEAADALASEITVN